MSDVAVRLATAADLEALAALRRAWVEENAGPIGDGGAFEREFAAWYAAESGRRLIWIATVGDQPVGMLSVVEFHRMPRPDRLVSRWGYISNVFVLAAHRNGGIGRELLDTAIAAAKDRGYARLVLSPSPRAVPLYERSGFARADELMLLPLA
jgi:GNAT superfamily N-acetyltransferase